MRVTQTDAVPIAGWRDLLGPKYLGACTVLAGGVALIGRVRGWQERRGLLVGWPAVSLIVTIVGGH